MTMMEEMKNIINNVLNTDGIEDGQRKELSERITTALVAGKYVNFDCIVLDPQKCVQLLATILNGFKAEKPFAILETPEEDPTTGTEAAGYTEGSPVDPRD